MPPLIRRRIECFLIGMCLGWTAGWGAVSRAADSPASRPHDFSKWEAAMAAFEAQDREQPPAPGGVLFVGSSTIRRWNTAELFPDLPVINRGFGGSELIDTAHFAERIVLPYRPRVIVVYAGSNDLARGTTPCQLLADFTSLVEQVDRDLPETEVVFLSIKPSLKRWPLIHRIRAANALIEAFCVERPRLHFLDVHARFLTAEGLPDPAYLEEDGLHLNAAGYRRLTDLVRPEIERLLAAPPGAAAPSPPSTASDLKTANESRSSPPCGG